MPACSACNCTNRTGSKYNTGFSFHRFPFSQPDLLKIWIHNVSRQNFIPTNASRLCSEHFEEACFDRTGQTVRLRADAVPTVFDFSQRQKKTKKPRKLPAVRTGPQQVKGVSVLLPQLVKQEVNTDAVWAPFSENVNRVALALPVSEKGDSVALSLVSAVMSETRTDNSNLWSLPVSDTTAVPSGEKLASDTNDNAATASLPSDHSYVVKDSRAKLTRKFQSVYERLQKTKKLLKLERQRVSRLKKRLARLVSLCSSSGIVQCEALLDSV